MPSLSGTSVFVAGAGLAGLAAAHDLLDRGADVIVVDARDRVGGRVWTVRDGFAESQHAEAGGDMIDEDHRAIRDLARLYDLNVVKILRHGFGYVRADAAGRPRIVPRSALRGWNRLARMLAPEIHAYRLAEMRWDTPITAAIARRSVASWLDAVQADDELRTTATGLRGFFLADPEELSLIALVDQFSASESPAGGSLYRIEGGNDRLATAIAAKLGDRLRLKCEVLAVSQRGPGVRITVKESRRQEQLRCDYAILALPATIVRRIPFTPSLPTPQHDAIARLAYGRATKTLLQFARPFWRTAGRPRAFGSALPFGALWDGNEEQRGRAGILTLLAGGSASDQTQAIVAKDGPQRLAQTLSWLGRNEQPLLASQQVVWEHDAYVRGGYAFFDPAFPPDLRAYLARPSGRVFFAGEHTSLRWQGYMNGAVESGQRAAAEIVASHGS
ncbi:MAG TPA: NAD(P)/FAD-dependent oxidoreductase [Vicinamibacterales bacterium]|jgi:monoamine oxidase